MVCVKEVYFVNKDLKGFRKRLAFLDTRIASRDANAAGSGFDRAEAQALRRLLSQVDEKGTACDPPAKDGSWKCVCGRLYDAGKVCNLINCENWGSGK